MRESSELSEMQTQQTSDFRSKSFSRIPGHTKHEKEKNPIWIYHGHENETMRESTDFSTKAMNLFSGMKCNTMLMLCNESSVGGGAAAAKVSRYCILCPESYQKIIDYEKKINHGDKITWYICKNGFVEGKTHRGILYIQQIILNVLRKNLVVLHIDNNPLNNKISNLYLDDHTAVSREQHKNKQYVDKPLPSGITQDMLKPYVFYYFNIYDSKKNKSRDFFRVEGHPKQNGKKWETSKSGKVSILEKLNQANQYAEILDS